MKAHDQIINGILMILSIFASNKVLVFFLKISTISITEYQRIGAILYITVSIYMIIKLLTLFFYALISIPVLIACLWNKGLYSKYDKWMTYRTKFRVLYLL